MKMPGLLVVDGPGMDPEFSCPSTHSVLLVSGQTGRFALAISLHQVPRDGLDFLLGELRTEQRRALAFREPFPTGRTAHEANILGFANPLDPGDISGVPLAGIGAL
jgi:hypothetical protein